MAETRQDSSGSPAGYTPIWLTANAFEITQLPTGRYHMYHVGKPPFLRRAGSAARLLGWLTIGELAEFDPPALRTYRIRLMQHLQTIVAPEIFTPPILYDGQATAYASRLLPHAKNENGAYFISMKSWKPLHAAGIGIIKIKFSLTSAEQIDPRHVYDLIQEKTRTPRALAALNLVQLLIQQGQNLYRTRKTWTSFNSTNGLKLEGSGLEVWDGIIQTVRPAHGRLIIVMQTSVGLAIDGTRSRPKSIRGLVPTAGEYFLHENELEPTVAQDVYTQLRNPKNIGVRLQSNDVVPLELCEVEPGQLFKNRLPYDLTTKFTRKAVVPPSSKMCKIKDAVQLSIHSKFILEAGMKISPSPITISAKLLLPPRIVFNPTDPHLTFKNGAWNTLQQGFTNPVAMKYWVIISFATETKKSIIFHDLRRHKSCIVESCTRLGKNGNVMNSCLSIRSVTNLGPSDVNESPFMVPAKISDDVEFTMSDAIKKYYDIQVFGLAEGQKPPITYSQYLRELMVVVILPGLSRAAPIRRRVKWWGDITLGVLTQCLQEGRLPTRQSRPNNISQYYNNVALKLNARLGGTNFYSDSQVMQQLKTDRFIIMGAGVRHPEHSVRRPSFTGVVYSLDDTATQYAALPGIQVPGVDRIMDLQDYVFQAIDTFGRKWKGPPKRLIFYRDGISETQFKSLALREISDIKSAFSKLWKKYEISRDKTPFPLLTYIVVGKREVKDGYTFAGTVVDSGVTNPAVPNFYLQSHSSKKDWQRQNASRSRHYSILHDENWHYDMQPLQELSYSLCHNYAKATCAISIPTPVNYADLVCSHGMLHFHPEEDDLDEESAYTYWNYEEKEIAMERWRKAFRKVHPNLETSMYFL
uniref:Piwi domain-containing protein n=1 Tax=Psilocybe cubensis TaxID=181762 RepID=A0A8H7Y049_PSICU